MRKILFIIIFSFSLSVFAQESINFQTSTFKEILALAKKEKKLVFIDAYAVWCAPCKLMEKNIFPLPAVKKYYNDNFINARFDMEKGEGRELAIKYGIRSYPSFLFLNGDGEVVLKNFGYMGEADFLEFAREANKPGLRTASYKEIFEKGEKDPEVLTNIMRHYAESDFDMAKKVSERYFTVKKDQPLTKDDLGLLLYFLRSTQDPNYQVFKTRKAEIVQLMSADVYDQFDANIKISKYLEGALDQKTGEIKDAYFFENAIPLIGKTNAETALNRMKVLYYPTVGKFDKYETAALAYYADAEAFDTEELMKAAYIFSQHSTAPAALKKAEEWAEKAVMKSETAENTYILAKIYSKTGKKEQAKTYAEIARNLALQSGQDPTLAVQLLDSLK